MQLTRLTMTMIPSMLHSKRAMKAILVQQMINKKTLWFSQDLSVPNGANRVLAYRRRKRESLHL